MAELAYQTLNNIDEATTNWTARVTVLCMKPPKLAKNNLVTLQKLIFADELGNCIDAVMFDKEIEKYKDIIKQDRTFIICNAAIKKADSVFKSSFSNTDYSWIINKNTLVSLTETHPGVGNPFRGSFTNYADLKIGSSISMIVLMINAQAPRRVPTGHMLTEYVGIDKDFNEIIISVWEDGTTEHTHSVLADYSLAALINFSVKANHCLSLSSNSSSSLVTKMQNPTFIEMEEWRVLNKDRIKDIITRGHSQGMKFDAISNKNLPEIHISELLVSDPKKKYIIIAKAKLVNYRVDFLYVCCNVCHTKTTAKYGESFMCMGYRCKVPRTAIRRFIFPIHIEDPTEKITAMVFGDIGMKILKINETEFYNKYSPDYDIPRDKIDNDLESATWKFTIYKNTNTFRESTTSSYILDDMVQIEDCKSIEETSTKSAVQGESTMMSTGKSPNNVTSSKETSSESDLAEKERLPEDRLKEVNDTISTKKRGRPRGSSNKHAKEIENITSVVLHQASATESSGTNTKKRGRPRGSCNKHKEVKPQTTTEMPILPIPESEDLSTEIDLSLQVKPPDVLLKEGNNVFDPNKKVKIEEVEDAKRDAAFRARTNTTTWDKNIIIDIDSEAQILGGVVISNKVLKKRGRPPGSRNKRTKTIQ